MANSPAVTAAPIHTSDHARSVSCNHLKIMANSAVIRARLTTKFSARASTTHSGIQPAIVLLSPASTALTTSETSSRNAVPHTSENDRSRPRTSDRKPPSRFFPGTFQIVFSAP